MVRKQRNCIRWYLNFLAIIGRRYQEILKDQVFLHMIRSLLLGFDGFNTKISWVEKWRFFDLRTMAFLLSSLSSSLLAYGRIRLVATYLRLSFRYIAGLFAKRCCVDEDIAAPSLMVTTMWRYLQEIFFVISPFALHFIQLFTEYVYIL